MAEPKAVAWDDLSVSCRNAFGRAAFAAAAAQGVDREQAEVGSGALLVGLFDEHGERSEPRVLLERFGRKRQDLVGVLDRLTPEEAPFDARVTRPASLPGFPSIRPSVERALLEARRLREADATGHRSLTFAHLFGGLLRSEGSSAVQALGVLVGVDAVAKVAGMYAAYLAGGRDARFDDFLEQVLAAPEPAGTGAADPRPAGPLLAGFTTASGRPGLGFRASDEHVVTVLHRDEPETGIAVSLGSLVVDANVAARLSLTEAAGVAVLELGTTAPLRPGEAPAVASLPRGAGARLLSYAGGGDAPVELVEGEILDERTGGPFRAARFRPRPATPGAPVLDAARRNSLVGVAVGDEGDTTADGVTLVVDASVLADEPIGLELRRAATVGTLEGAGNDLVADEDQLGFRAYVEAFADLVTSPHTRPPLTIGIYGSWGMGKSFLLGHIEREIARRQAAGGAVGPHVYTVHFNAWEYSATEVVWPGLVRKIVRTLDEEVRWPLHKRLWTRLRWNLGREARRVRALVATAIVTGIGLVLWRWWTAGAALAWAAVAGAGGLVKLATNPIGRWVTALFEESDYGRHIGHMEEIKHDLESLEQRLHADGDPERTVVGRILVVIDDLDRCEPEKAVEVLQAVNLLLNFPSFVVCLGIDARVVTGAVERHYEGLLGESGASGYEYLDKIVQIPFRIPSPSEGDVKEFLAHQLGRPDPPGRPRAPAPAPTDGGERPETERTAAPPAEEPAEHGPAARPEGAAADGADGEPEAAVAFTYDELQAFERLAPFLRPNPRHLKRLVNVYRLVRALARTAADGAIASQPAAAVRWLVVCGQWPYSAYAMLARFEELLEEWDEDLSQAPDADPLLHLLDDVEPRLDEPTRRRLDEDADALRDLLELEDGRLTWEDLRRIRRYTVNFNPAVEEEVRAESAP